MFGKSLCNVTALAHLREEETLSCGQYSSHRLLSNVRIKNRNDNDLEKEDT